MPHCRRTYYYQVRGTFLQFGAYPEDVRRRSVSVDSPQVRWRELSPDIYAWRMERRSKHAAKASHLAGSGEGDGHVSQWREGSAALPSASVMGTRAGLAAPGTALMKTREGRPEFAAGSALPSSKGAFSMEPKSGKNATGSRRHSPGGPTASRPGSALATATTSMPGRAP